MRIKGGKKGFTLVELSLSIGFIAILSLTVTLIINDTAATYRRGITLNQVNTTGMDLMDDFRTAIQSSPVRSPESSCGTMFSVGDAVQKCEDDDAASMIIVRREAYVDVNEDGIIGSSESDEGGEEKIPVYGAICLGSFTYIWNSGYFFGENASGEKANMSGGSERLPRASASSSSQPLSKAIFSYTKAYTDENGDAKTTPSTEENFRLLKVKDPQRGICKNVIQQDANASNEMNISNSKIDKYRDAGYWADNLTNEFTADLDNTSNPYMDYFPQDLKEEDVEVILDDSSTNPLALYDFTITTPASNSAGEAAFYSSSFILGTLTGGINVKAKGNFCKTPDTYDEDFDYCAINKFNFAAQATGG